MSTSRIPKILLGVVLVGASLGWLIWTASRSNLVYYYEIDEARAAVQPDQQIRLSGDVVDGTIRKSPEDARLDFAIQDEDGSSHVPVTYAGTVPDIFKSGIQVVVEGRFDGTGTFRADRLTAKCPSKYQAAGDLGGPANAPTRAPSAS